MCAELQALEQEQRQIDGRAAEVETQLRGLMESGRRAAPPKHTQSFLTLTLAGLGGMQLGMPMQVLVPI